MDHQGFGISHVCQETCQFYLVDKAFSSFQSTLDTKDDNRSELSLPQVLLGGGMAWMIWEPRIGYPSDRRVLLQPLCQLERV
jgi:hypothetical protein